MTKHKSVSGNGPQSKVRGAAAVEFALILPLLLLLLLGVIDFGFFFGQNISLQAASREGARQGVTQGDVLASTIQAKGLLHEDKLQIKYVVDTSAGTPGVIVVCVRYPESSLTGLFSSMLNGVSDAKSVMRMEGPATSAAGSKNWSGGTCAA